MPWTGPIAMRFRSPAGAHSFTEGRLSNQSMIAEGSGAPRAGVGVSCRETEGG